MSCGSNECTGYAVAVGMTGLSYGRPVLVLRMNGVCGVVACSIVCAWSSFMVVSVVSKVAPKEVASMSRVYSSLSMR